MNFFYILTFGCQMNKSDSERIAGLLSSIGLEMTDKPAEADVLCMNTCSVRQSAEDRAYGFIKNWQKFRVVKPDLIIAVTGCMPGRDSDGKLLKKLHGVDLFFPIEELQLMPERLKGLNYSLHIAGTPVGTAPYLSVNPARQNNFKSSITIQTGCNNFCTYCIVPYSRGREKNRSVKEILNEIKDFVAKGGKEVTLLGQVVNNYQATDPEEFSTENIFSKDHFAALLWEINQIEGLERLNWTAADPQHFNNDQIQALTLPKQVNYLHLPVQSGDNEILRIMNRKYTREQYIDLIKKIRDVRADIAIGTDIIVGFPGETGKQFENTLDLYRQCDFDIAYQAMYSERSGTAAAKAFKDDVPREEKKRRWQAIQDLMEETAYRKNRNYKNKVVSVLVEGCEKGICFGNSSEMKFVQFPGAPEMIGKIVNVKINDPETWVLRGVVDAV